MIFRICDDLSRAPGYSPRVLVPACWCGHDLFFTRRQACKSQSSQPTSLCFCTTIDKAQWGRGRPRRARGCRPRAFFTARDSSEPQARPAGGWHWQWPGADARRRVRGRAREPSVHVRRRACRLLSVFLLLVWDSPLFVVVSGISYS
jgi:hypothetical protein